MKPQVVTYHLNNLLKDDAIISSDSGTIATWFARYIDIRGDMKFSLSGTLATMANGCHTVWAQRWPILDGRWSVWSVMVV